MADTRIVLDGVLLPKFSDFKRIDIGNKTRIKTLGGGQYTNFVNNSRSWQITWVNMKYSDYVTVRNIYYAMFVKRHYAPFQYDAENIYTYVELEISEANLRLNQTLIPTFTLVLTEGVGVS